MRYFSMFSGIAGFEKGIEDAGVSGECIGFSEIDKNAINIYKHHFPGHHNYGSAFDIKTADLPDFDFLVGGFPCQAFSIAGKRLGFQDTRGTLFFEIARILSDKRPRNFLLENVKGLLSHDEGKTFQTILGVLSDLGYWVEWQVLNSKNFGVPQNRERVFFVGHLGGEPARKVFPIGSINEASVREDQEALGEGERVRGSYISAAVDANYHKGAGSTRQMVGEGFVPLTETRTEEAKRIRRTSQAAGVDFSPRRGKEFMPREDGIGNCVTAGLSNEHMLTDFYRIRRLTPVECERLQGFPDDWTKYGADGKMMSDSARYKACGNAVTTNVIRAIVERLFAVDPEIEDLLR